jgi:serine/threonine-protein kinase
VEVRLTASSGPDLGRVFRFAGPGRFVLGRAGTPDADLQRPSDPGLSREHLVLDVSRQGVQARCLEGKSAFWLDGVARREGRLATGSEVRVGGSAYRVEIADEAEEPPASGRAASLPRRSLEEFELGSELGRGALGVVREAVDSRDGRRVAIKLLAPEVSREERAVTHFLRESEIAAHLQHPNIVRTLGVGRADEQLFLVMERVRGADLESRLAERGTLDPGQAVEVGTGVLQGLAYAHALGFVHRDVKPENIMVLEGPKGLEVCLLDFGLARSFVDSGMVTITHTGEGKGTLRYAAPECLVDAKHATPAADVFSLGATLYRALTGACHVEEREGGMDLLQALVRVDLVPLASRRPDLPARLIAVVEKALRADPGARWESAEAMARGLLSAGSGVTAAAGPRRGGAAGAPPPAREPLPVRADRQPTEWARIRALGAQEAPAVRDEAWRHLNTRYRPAMSAYVRALLRRWAVAPGRLHEEAADLVQGFLVACVEKGWLGRADPGRGRFRAFVRTLLRRWVRDQMEKRLARRRMPASGAPASLDAHPAPPGDAGAIDPARQAFRLEWTECLVRAALERVRAGHEDAARYLDLLLAGQAEDAEAVAAALGVQPRQVPVRRHRARRILAEEIWNEIKATLVDPEEREQERAALAPFLRDLIDPGRHPSFGAGG